MADAKPNDHGERPTAIENNHAIDAAEVQQVRNCTRDELEAVKASNVDRSDGSATPKSRTELYAQAIQDGQERSLEIYDSGKREVIASRVIPEKIEAATAAPKQGLHPTGESILKVAEKLAKDTHRWESGTTGKCNQFVEAAVLAAGIPSPWKVGQADCHTMRVALDRECTKPHSKWQRLYNYDSKHGLESDQKFARYHPKDGDIIIWDKVWDDKWVQHTGITAEPYSLLYAGARDPKKHGVGKTDIYNFTGAEPYGAPTAVYRYKG
ncbi:hypothetical protein KBI23_23730 [bacterium]|nr:hypothetical protein [bacterium]MBP9809475.1 hypothetical protein [bacterium]